MREFGILWKRVAFLFFFFKKKEPTPSEVKQISKRLIHVYYAQCIGMATEDSQSRMNLVKKYIQIDYDIFTILPANRRKYEF